MSEIIKVLRQIHGALRPLAARLFAVPLIGYSLRILVGILKLPRLNFHLRRLEDERAGIDGRLRRMEVLATEASGRLGQLEAAAPETSGRLGQLEAMASETNERSTRLAVLASEIPRIMEIATASQTALRALRRSPVVAPAAAGGVQGAPYSAWIDPQIEVVPEIQLRREAARSMNRLPRLSDWSVGGPLTSRMGELHEPNVVHRKSWEYAICIEGLQAMGVVHPDAQAVAVGAGYERPLFYYANTIRRMVATDLYDNPEHEGQPAMLTEPERFSPFPYRRDALEVLQMGGDDLRFSDCHFDFAFCLSSIEHFGSRETQRRALDEMARVVRPGGAVCIITELVLNGEPHAEYFLPAEMQAMFLEHPQLRLEGPPPDLRISEALLACAVDVRVPADLSASPHVILTDGRVLWTSLSLFFRKAA